MIKITGCQELIENKSPNQQCKLYCLCNVLDKSMYCNLCNHVSDYFLKISNEYLAILRKINIDENAEIIPRIIFKELFLQFYNFADFKRGKSITIQDVLLRMDT